MTSTDEPDVAERQAGELDRLERSALALCAAIRKGAEDYRLLCEAQQNQIVELLLEEEAQTAREKKADDA